MIKVKKIVATALALAMTATMLVGCGTKKEEGANNSGNASNGTKEKVSLKVWSSADDRDFMKKMGDKFNQENDKYEVTFDFKVCGEDKAKEQVTKDGKQAADVFLYPSDQTGDMVRGKYLRELDSLKTLGLDPASILDAQAIKSGTIDGKLYGLPYTNNILFLYYNKSLLTETDVTKLETIMAKKTAADVKNFAVDISNGFYNNMFFAANGCELYGADGTDTKTVTWNTPAGVEVVKYLNTNLVNSPKFHKPANNDHETMLKEGKLAAYVGGGWDAAKMKELLGTNYAATILPTINIGGQDKPLKPFAAFKHVGVNAATQQPEAAARFAYFLVTKEVQELRFKERGYAPTATELLSQQYDDPAVLASINQAKETNSVLTPTATNFGNFWDAAKAIGDKIYKKDADMQQDAGIQKNLNSAVASMTAEVKQ